MRFNIGAASVARIRGLSRIIGALAYAEAPALGAAPHRVVIRQDDQNVE